MALTGLLIKTPNGDMVQYLEFEVHKDPIRSQTSDGVQYRLKIKGKTILPDSLTITGLIESDDIDSMHFWINKCFRCELFFGFGLFPKHTIYLLPMSYQTFNSGEMQFVCMDITEKLINIEKRGTELTIGLDDFTIYFKKRLSEAQTWVNDAFSKAKLQTKVNIITTVGEPTIERSNNIIIKSPTMKLANYLLDQGWFKCPQYSFYDSFNLPALENNKELVITYDFINLGQMKDKLKKVNFLTQFLNVGILQQVSPFFDEKFSNKFISQQSTFDFTKGGGYDVCINDGSIEQVSGSRLEIPVVYGSVENTRYKLCCLKQLVALNPQVYTGQIKGQQPVPLTFTEFFGFDDKSNDLVIAINYLFKPSESASNINYTCDTRFKTLRIDSEMLNSSKYLSLDINGKPCILFD